MRNKSLISVLLFSCFLFFVSGRSEAQRVKQIGIEDGISDKRTYTILQDKKGFLWISTRFGINRYDGENVEEYTLDILNNREKGTPVESTYLLFDRDSVLWAYTNLGGIYKYNQKQNVFDPKVNLNRYIKTVGFDNNNQLWAGSRSYLVHIQDTVVTNIKDPALQDAYIKKIIPLSTGNLLLVAEDRIAEFDIQLRKVKRVIEQKADNSPPLIIESCFYDSQKGIAWIGSQKNGIYQLHLPTFRLRHIEEKTLTDYPIISIASNNDSTLLLGTDGSGLCVLNTRRESVIEVYNQRADKEHQISSNAVYCISRDRLVANRIWIATYSDGINRIDRSESNFKTLKHETNNSNSLCNNLVYSILENSGGDYWFATETGISVWNKKTDIWKTLFENRNIITMFEDSKGFIWVSVYSSGVYAIDKYGNVKKHFNYKKENKNSIGSNFIYTIFEDCSGNMWFGCRRGPVTKYIPETDSFKQYEPLLQANHIVQKNDGTILISCDAGIYQVPANGNVLKRCPFSDQLKSFYVSDMWQESDSILWLATYGSGINRCNITQGTVTFFTTNEGLKSNFVHAIVPDDNHQLWYSSEDGLGKLDINSHAVENFTADDGTSGNIFRQLSRMHSSDGKLYFGSYGGVTYFDPTHITERAHSARLYFKELRLFNQPVTPGANHSPLIQSIDETDQLILKYSQNSITLDFSVIDYAVEKDRLFSWKLEGLDENWVSLSAGHIANYTNLTPGEYTLHVRYYSDNHELLDERSMGIVIHPPFWNTVWAKILEFLFLLMVVYAIYTYIRQRFRKKQSDERIKFFIHMAHDIRTPLTLIKSPVYELKESVALTEKSVYLIDLITSNLEKLTNLFAQLLDFQKAYEAKDKLYLKRVNINALIRNKVMFWKIAAQKKNIIIEIYLPEEDVYEWFDETKIERVIDNLLSNAVKYTPVDGLIKVKLVRNAKSWQIFIIDNGIGISGKELKHLFTRFYRTDQAMSTGESGSGLGLLLVKQYIVLHGGTIDIKSSKNKGTEMVLKFRSGYEHYKNYVLKEVETTLVNNVEGDVEGDDLVVEKRKYKLLIVEDDAELREFLQKTLASFYDVSAHPDGKQAWELVQTINPDIILTDLYMPVMTGFELCEKIKNTYETSHIPVIVLTAVSDDQTKLRGLSCGVDDYIEKPFEIKYLRTKVDNILNNRRLLRRKFLGIGSFNDVVNESENKHNKAFIDRIEAIINDHLADSTFTIAQLSKEMGLSRSILYSKFGAVTGYTPNDYIKILRMKKAIEYFNLSKYTINEVALMVGFEEPAYFSTCFKKTYGKSPIQFIEENKG